MDLIKLKRAMHEADRFLQRANELIVQTGGSAIVSYSYPSEQGAVKRASMDLSRALSKLRNNKE